MTHIELYLGTLSRKFLGSYFWGHIFGVKFLRLNFWVLFLGSYFWGQIFGVKFLGSYFLGSNFRGQIFGVLFLGSNFWSQIFGVTFLSKIFEVNFRGQISARMLLAILEDHVTFELEKMIG
jgi:hypothetical protein